MKNFFSGNHRYSDADFNVRYVLRAAFYSSVKRQQEPGLSVSFVNIFFLFVQGDFKNATYIPIKDLLFPKGRKE